MKRLLLFTLILPTLVFAQERQQKMNLRNYGTVSPRVNTQPSPSYQQPYRNGAQEITPYSESRSKLDYRRQRQEDRFHSGGKNNIYLYDPYWNYGLGWNDWTWGPNRWYRWGAPYWYDNWRPWYYYDNWGYRQPARIYLKDNGKSVDTIRGIKPRITVGLQSNKAEIGGFFAIGNKTLFIAEYQHRYQRDRSVFYPELTRDVVIPWEDRKLGNIVKGGALFLGIGQRFRRTSAFGELGIVSEKNRYQYYDELFILSNNGNYSFPNYRDAFLALKFGLMHDIKSATIKADYEPTRNLVTIGLGVNF